MFRRGVEALRANDIAAAIELLNQAVGLDPADPQSQLQLGVALQATGRHAEALARLKTAQALLADDAAPFLHAAVSHLALADHQPEGRPLIRQKRRVSGPSDSRPRSDCRPRSA